MRKNNKMYVDQSDAKIGVNRVDNINVVTIAGKVVDRGCTTEVVEDEDINFSAESGESFAISYSKNVWVNGKRVC